MQTSALPRAIFVPALLCIGAGLISIASGWALLAIPFILLGSFCAAPNFNLADGLLAIVAVAVGMIVVHFQSDAGTAIVVGTASSWFLSGIEKQYRARPLDDR